MNATETNCVFPVTDFEDVKLKLLNWLSRFSNFCFLDNHGFGHQPVSEECLAGAGARNMFCSSDEHALHGFSEFMKSHSGWLFGHITYQLKNETIGFHSLKNHSISFPDLCFFEPEYLFRLSRHELQIRGPGDLSLLYTDIMNECHGISVIAGGAEMLPRFSKEEYISAVKELQGHIRKGDCYEINFCQEFYNDCLKIDPLQVYLNLSRISPNPFSAFYRLNNNYLLCASPERYLKKEGNRMISQPMKGTAGRNLSDQHEDLENKKWLRESKKEQSENVMVVDLVRNDLSRICKPDSVKVDELFGIYSFPQVYQMISTVSGTLESTVDFSEIIRATFPMGSMTGAPKRRVMELIDQYENTGRGIFSGAVGYIRPDGDFDLNVVIRSIMYDQLQHYVSFMAGSGITIYSDAESEYEECLIKAAAMSQALSPKIKTLS